MTTKTLGKTRVRSWFPYGRVQSVVPRRFKSLLRASNTLQGRQKKRHRIVPQKPEKSFCSARTRSRLVSLPQSRKPFFTNCKPHVTSRKTANHFHQTQAVFTNCKPLPQTAHHIPYHDPSVVSIERTRFHTKPQIMSNKPQKLSQQTANHCHKTTTRVFKLKPPIVLQKNRSRFHKKKNADHYFAKTAKITPREMHKLISHKPPIVSHKPPIVFHEPQKTFFRRICKPCPQTAVVSRKQQSRSNTTSKLLPSISPPRFPLPQSGTHSYFHKNAKRFQQKRKRQKSHKPPISFSASSNASDLKAEKAKDEEKKVHRWGCREKKGVKKRGMPREGGDRGGGRETRTEKCCI